MASTTTNWATVWLATDFEAKKRKQELETLVSSPSVVQLQDAYVPRGPQTLSSLELDVPNSGTQPDEPDVVTATSNRYAGVIYAARFFVTRVGFLRSVRRIMVLSSNHMTIIDPHTDEVKERYAYDSIKEIVCANDGTGAANVDRSFTLHVGKSIKETYTCRNRQFLLSAYYQLRERASSAKKDAVDIDTPVGPPLLPGMTADTPMIPATMPSLATTMPPPGGMYFDSLFQLCGKTFTMVKLSTTRSTAQNPVKLDVLLAVRASSLDRLHPETRATLSSILLIDIVKIQRVTTNTTELLVFYENNRVHRYWSDSREPFIQAISNNLRSWLNTTLFVEEVADSCEFDALTSTRDIPMPVAFEIPVLKISNSSPDKLQLRLLALTSSAVIERDPVRRRTLATHSLSAIFNIVMYPSISSSQNEQAIESEGTCGKFALEFKHGRTRRYICLNSAVNRRDKEIGLGLDLSTSEQENDLKRVITDIGGETAIPPWLRVGGATTLLNPKEARSLFLCNLVEMCRMNKLHVSWSTEETRIACKEGTWGSEVHPELEEIMLRKLAGLSLIPNLVTRDSLEQVFLQLEQFNRNVPLGGLRQRDRRAFVSLMKLLESFKEYSVAQLKSPSNSDMPVPTAEFQVALLLAIQRLLCTRGVFEEIPSSQYKHAIDAIMELLHSPMEEVSFAAACVIKYMVINYSDTRSMKSEAANRRVVLTRRRGKLLISRAFDMSRTNRIGRLPRQALGQYRNGKDDIMDATRDERSMGSALSYSELGLDYLVTSLVLQTLEVCLSSGKKATPERVVHQLLRAMRVDEFMRHHTLFLYNRSLSFSVTKCSSILVKVHVLEQPSELVELIQDFARKHGALTWQLYLSLYAQEKAQRRISSQLVALLTHENPRSSAVIRNVFPHALLDDLQAEQLEYDEFGRQLPASGTDLVPASTPTRRRSRANSMDATNTTESGRSRISYGYNTRPRVVKNTKCVVLLPEFFDRLWKTYSTKDLIWGPHVIEEVVQKLEAEVASLDIFRLRYQYFLYTDPLEGDDVVLSWDLLDTSQQDQQSQPQSYPFEFVYAPSESRLAVEIKRGNVSSSNRFAQYMPIMFLLDPQTAEEVASEDGGEDTDDNSGDEKSPPAGPTVYRAGTKPPPVVTAMTNDSEVVTAPAKRKHKKGKKKLAHVVPHWFVSWNANEFHVDFDCLRNQVRVGPYYLTNLLNDRGVLTEDVEGTEKFMTLLYFRLLAEHQSQSREGIGRSPTHSSGSSLMEIDESDIRLLILKIMIQVYERQFIELGSLMFLNHLIQVVMKPIPGTDYRWPLVVRGNTVYFLDRVLSSALNVARFLREDDNLTIIMDLLKEAKPLVVRQEPTDGELEYVIEESEVEDDLEELESEFDEETDDGEFVDQEEFDSEEELLSDQREYDNAMDEQQDAELSQVSPAALQDSAPEIDEPSRCIVVAEHCGSMSPAMIVQTCLSVLSRLIDCNTSEDESSSLDIRFPKSGRAVRFEGSAVNPVSHIKDRLCDTDTLRFLVSLLDSPNRLVFKKCLNVLRLLIRHNEAIIPSLHTTGLFYYLLRYAQDVDDMTIAARMMSHLHLRQTLSVATTLHANNNTKDEGIPLDPLTEICQSSWLIRVLPMSMVAQLLRHGPKSFAIAIFSDSDNPEIIWNATMRAQLLQYIDNFMSHRVDSSGVFQLSEHDVDHGVCKPMIDYPKEIHALQCYQYYLHHLLNEKAFPGWAIDDEGEFVDSLMDAIYCWVHPAAPGSSGQPLSIEDGVLLLDATALLLRRFPESSAITNLRCFSYLLETLEKCIVELGGTRNGLPNGNCTIDKDVGKSKRPVIQALQSSIRVIHLATSLSEENSRACSSALGIRALSAALQLLLRNSEVLQSFDAFDAQVTTHWVLETLGRVLNQQNGRVCAATQSRSLLPSLTQFLTQHEDLMATELTIQIVQAMGRSQGDIAELLLLHLAQHGIVWYLTLLLFAYHSQPMTKPESDNNDTNLDRISLGAAKALEEILNAHAREESVAAYVKEMQETIENIFTPALIGVLRTSGTSAFLDVLVSEVRLPHMMWTDRMRQELLELARRAVLFHSAQEHARTDNHKIFEIPTPFVYSAQKEQLCVAGIYVYFFNDNPRDGIEAQIIGTQNPTLNVSERSAAARKAVAKKPPSVERSATGNVMHGLLNALSHDIAGVRAQPSMLESVLLPRMIPVATAIRHLLQYSVDVDAQVLYSDGILTLLYILDHEAQPQSFSFSYSAQLLQLRCIESLHLLSFSGKCQDTLATQVSPFVKSAFQIVYKNLAKSDASTEGQLARITLQFLGNVCLIPACVDILVKGMSPIELSNVLPSVWAGEPGEVQLLLCIHMIPLKRHSQPATQFAKAAVGSQLASCLLNLLSSLAPTAKVGESTQTKSYAARFLSVLSSNPGSGGAIASLLVSSRVWETHGDSSHGSAEDLRRLLVPPHAPGLLKSELANPNKIVPKA